jgi:hypothetical protein
MGETGTELRVQGLFICDENPSGSANAHRQIKMQLGAENATLSCGRRPQDDAVDGENRVTIVDQAAANSDSNDVPHLPNPVVLATSNPPRSLQFLLLLAAMRAFCAMDCRTLRCIGQF